MYPTLDDIRQAADRIEKHIHHTPVLTCGAIDEMAGASLFFKCENFQKTGSFKARGAMNAVHGLTDRQSQNGVATHSSGNHAAALALAARSREIPAYVVMPENAPEIKKNAVSDYGANITYCEPTLTARETVLKQLTDNTGAVFIPPYNDYRIITGQGTAALEFHDNVSGLDIVMVPVGGGGLLGGTALLTHALSPATRVIGVEPEQADDACRSFKSGELVPSVSPVTIADGLLTSLGDITFAIMQKYVDDMVSVSEAGIALAMRQVWERMKIIIEPSAAVPLAACLEHKLEMTGKRVGIILSGGNVDLEQLPWLGSV